MHRRRCKLSVLTISKILKILDGLASQFSWPQEVCYCLINHIQTELITQIYSYPATFTFLSQSIIHQTHVFSFQDFINSKGSCLWGGPIKLRNLFTTLLALTRLWGHYPTLPYSKLKTTTRWDLTIGGWDHSKRQDLGILDQWMSNVCHQCNCVIFTTKKYPVIFHSVIWHPPHVHSLRCPTLKVQFKHPECEVLNTV